MYTFILVFHQLVCGPGLGPKMDALRKQDPAMDVHIVLNLGDWSMRHCLIVERHVGMPTFMAEI